MTNNIVGNWDYTRQKLNLFIWETTLVTICTHRNRRQSNQVSVPRQITRDLRSVSLVKNNFNIIYSYHMIHEWYNNESNHSAITFPTVTVCLHSQHSLQRIQTNYSQIDLMILRKNDYIEVVDGCWRWNVSVTTLKMSVTVLAILITNIHYRCTFASSTNIQKMSPTSKFSQQHPQIVNNLKSLTSLSP